MAGGEIARVADNANQGVYGGSAAVFEGFFEVFGGFLIGKWRFWGDFDMKIVDLDGEMVFFGGDFDREIVDFG
jgi:hypothetical protein